MTPAYGLLFRAAAGVGGELRGKSWSRAHRRDAGYFNAGARRTGCLFQRRFGAVAMDGGSSEARGPLCLTLDPLCARWVARATDWPHSSPRAPIAGVDDGLVSVQPSRDRVGDFAGVLETDPDDPAFAALRRNAPIGRPLGSPVFLDAVSRRPGRPATPAKRGRKPKAAGL